MSIDWSNCQVTVTGGSGFLGRAVCAVLRQRGCRRLSIPRRAAYDLTSELAVRRMYDDLRPDIVIHLAAEVGGIGANRRSPGRFFYANLAMGLHLIECARRFGIQKFVQIGTVCAYPKFAPVPFRESDLVHLIASQTGFRGTIEWDDSQPDGQPRRCLDTTRAAEWLGWQAGVSLEDGLRRTIEWYCQQPSRVAA